MLQLGTRIRHQKAHLGTIRFAGSVEGTSGTWLGVEWDDAELRGKHDGVHGGRQYFHCVVPGAGSFIRFSATSIDLGTSFISALLAKYVGGSGTAPVESGAARVGGVETYVLGSSNGRIEVEAPGLDRVRGKFANISRLREISLDGEVVASCSPNDEQLAQLCKNVRGLNLSKNLIPDWDTIGIITSQLPSLQSLNLDFNRFVPVQSPLASSSTSKLTELRLNNTLVRWAELKCIGAEFPNLEELQFGYNRVGAEDQLGNAPPLSLPNLRILYLDKNDICSWQILSHAISCLPKLERLHVSSNLIPAIPAPSSPSVLSLRQLSVTFNGLKIWPDIDALAAWCPSLETLSIFGNPLLNEERYARQFITARIGSLKMLDGSTIRDAERQDSELFYLSHISQSTKDEANRVKEHPRWLELCDLHERPDTRVENPASSKLSSKLIDITVFALPGPLSEFSLSRKMLYSAAVDMRVLPSMTVQMLRLKIVKTMKGKGVTGNFRMWALLPGAGADEWIVRELTDGRARIDFCGLEHKAGVAVAN